MGTVVYRWGNSLAVRIPKASLDAAQLHEGDALTISTERGSLVLRRSERIDIDKLIDSITPKTLPDESYDFRPVGRELL
jgi:antitoxin MazE